MFSALSVNRYRARGFSLKDREGEGGRKRDRRIGGISGVVKDTRHAESIVQILLLYDSARKETIIQKKDQATRNIS